MKVRIINYNNSPKYLSKWMIEVKNKKGRFEPLYNGDKPYYFYTKDEAAVYLSSIKDSLMEQTIGEVR